MPAELYKATYVTMMLGALLELQEALLTEQLKTYSSLPVYQFCRSPLKRFEFCWRFMSNGNTFSGKWLSSYIVLSM